MKKIDIKVYTIGQVVSLLSGSYPNLSISKIRYLEDEGLLELSRTKGGYRQFSDDDLLRLEEILKLQRDYFMPLQVIKEKMRDWDASKAASRYRLEMEESDEAEEGESEQTSLEEALAKTGLTAEAVKSLENFGLLRPKQTPEGKMVDSADMQVMRLYSELVKFGLEARHLRIYENFSNKETMLFQQILSPQLKHKNQETRRKIKSDLNHLVNLTEKLQRLLRDKSLGHLELI